VHRLMLVLVMMGLLVLGVAIGGVLNDRSESAALGASRKCSKASLDGTYGVRFDGQSKALGRFASVSIWRFNGKGRLKASETYNSEKTGPQRRRIAGRYVVKSSCSFKLLFPSELVKNHEAAGACVLVANRKEFTCLDAEEGWVTTGTGRKI
jgi:hypothetical protein